MARMRLEVPREIEEEITKKKKLAEDLRDSAEAIGSPSEIKPRVVTSAVSTAGFEDIIIKIAVIEGQIETLREKQSRAVVMIRRATEELSERDRTILAMRYCWLWKRADIAKALGVSLRTAHRWLKEAIRNYYKT